MPPNRTATELARDRRVFSTREQRIGNIGFGTILLAIFLFGALLIILSLAGCGKDEQAAIYSGGETGKYANYAILFEDKKADVLISVPSTNDGWKLATWSFNDEFTVRISNWEWVTNYCASNRPDGKEFTFELRPAP